MSEVILKKFYTKILRLLQSKQAGGMNEGQIKSLKAFKDSADKGEMSEVLLQLGLHDIHAFIEALQGHGQQALDVNQVVPDKIVLDYFESILPIVEDQLHDIENVSLPPHTKKLLRNIIQHTQLLQQMFIGVQQKDFVPIMQIMINAYPKQTPAIKKQIAATLKQVGRPVVLALVHSLFRDGGQHSELPELLREMGYLAVPALIVALYYPEEKVRYAAAEVLKKMKAREAVPSLIETLQDPSWRVRKIAAETLGEIKAPRAVSALIKSLEDKHASVRLATVRALGNLRSPQALRALIKVLEDPSWEVRRAVVEAVAKFGPSASPVLAKALENDSLVVRKIASRLLAEIGTEPCAALLMKSSQDQDISVRERSIVALGRIKGEEALVNLMYALEDKAPLVRFAAVQALTNIGSRSALPILNKAAKDPEKIIRQRANWAIEMILKREESTAATTENAK